MSTKFPDPGAEVTQAPISAGQPPVDPDLAAIEEWFMYHAQTPEQQVRYQTLRSCAKDLARVIVMCCPRSADRTAALRKLRECVMTANAAIACHGR